VEIGVGVDGDIPEPLAEGGEGGGGEIGSGAEATVEDGSGVRAGGDGAEHFGRGSFVGCAEKFPCAIRIRGFGDQEIGIDGEQVTAGSDVAGRDGGAVDTGGLEQAAEGCGGEEGIFEVEQADEVFFGATFESGRELEEKARAFGSVASPIGEDEAGCGERVARRRGGIAKQDGATESKGGVTIFGGELTFFFSHWFGPAINAAVMGIGTAGGEASPSADFHDDGRGIGGGDEFTVPEVSAGDCGRAALGGGCDAGEDPIGRSIGESIVEDREGGEVVDGAGVMEDLLLTRMRCRRNILLIHFSGLSSSVSH